MHAYLFGGNQLTQVNLTVSANVSSYNAFTAAGSPSSPCAVTVTIASGVIIGGTTTAAPFQTGTWPASSTFLLINNGYIEGAGGAGNGGLGKDALNTALDIAIDNTNGFIRGGGGGGAQGSIYTDIAFGSTLDGGGGGGGQGNPGGAGGAPTGAGATAGSAGSRSSNGAGGSAESSGRPAPRGEDGGAGGGWGGNGQQSGTDSGGGFSTAFGAGGKAVALNGHSVTWRGGFNSTQVRGAVA